jgi:hypothetical protein
MVTKDQFQAIRSELTPSLRRRRHRWMQLCADLVQYPRSIGQEVVPEKDCQSHHTSLRIMEAYPE